MLTRPTTQQILLDARRELLATIEPAVTDPGARIALQMMENVLRNCAERSAHEVAWMRDEITEMVAYAERVAASTAAAAELHDALAAHRAGATTSLHVDDLAGEYDLAGACLSLALEAALASGDHDLHRAGREVLLARLGREQQITGEWTMVGRG